MEKRQKYIWSQKVLSRDHTEAEVVKKRDGAEEFLLSFKMVSKMVQLHNTNSLQAVVEIRENCNLGLGELFLGQEKIFLFSYIGHLFLNFPGIPAKCSVA